MTTKIEWTDVTWNPITGCTPISEGCAHCYAARMATRLRGRYGYPKDEPFRVTLHKDRLTEPYSWRKSRKVFVVSMGDLFHEDVPSWFISEMFQVMEHNISHKFILLTKRPMRMKNLMNGVVTGWEKWHRQHIWCGVTAENQNRADERIQALLKVRSHIRWVSAEPLLGSINILAYLDQDKINWVVIGPETGPKRRPCDPAWIMDLIQQCSAAEIPYFVKAFPLSDGRISRDMNEWPEWARVRQFPKEAT